MSEEAPKLTTAVNKGVLNGAQFVYATGLYLLVAEAYEVAIAAGWETKALDLVNKRLRELQ